MSDDHAATFPTLPGELPEGIVRAVSLGQGLELWHAPVKALREQDLNAQVQTQAMFDRLTATIRRDARLEALPYCAAVPRQVSKKLTVIDVEIVSGHHRVRAAIAGGLAEVWCVVDVSGLTRDQIAAKQLAHNTIHGSQDEELIARIFQQIQDAEARLEAFVPEGIETDIPTVAVPDIDLKIDYQPVLVMFLASERASFEEAARHLQGLDLDTTYVADLERFEDFRTVVQALSREYDVRSMGTILAKMAEICRRHLGHDLEYPEGQVPLRDILGASFLDATEAAVLGAALDALSDTKSRAGRKDALLKIAQQLTSNAQGGRKNAKKGTQRRAGRPAAPDTDTSPGTD